MEERAEFVVLAERHEETIAELCRWYGVSRETGYKWLRRYESEGLAGLADRSRAPHHHARSVSVEMENAVVAERALHPKWGPKKLLVCLRRQDEAVKWPAASTIGDILKRRGLTVPRRRRHRSPAYSRPFVGCDGPNAVWSADFKGWFMTGDGRRCDPFTLTDNYSRYLLRCQVVGAADHAHIRPIVEAAFREYGLPLALRTDNGPPFATTTIGGLSRLSIWLIRLGVWPERIEPGKPAQNGRHERMHKTLKDETAAPPQRTARLQQMAFDRFRQEYNEDRPHEGIGQQTPDSFYQPSDRQYPKRIPELTYPDHYELRKVRSNGEFKWRSRGIYISDTLVGETIGFERVVEDSDSKKHDHLWNIYFGPIRLGTFDARSYKIKRDRYPYLKSEHTHGDSKPGNDVEEQRKEKQKNENVSTISPV